MNKTIECKDTNLPKENWCDRCRNECKLVAKG
jgi:hypothetical protein